MQALRREGEIHFVIADDDSKRLFAEVAKVAETVIAERALLVLYVGVVMVLFGFTNVIITQSHVGNLACRR